MRPAISASRIARGLAKAPPALSIPVFILAIYVPLSFLPRSETTSIRMEMPAMEARETGGPTPLEAAVAQLAGVRRYYSGWTADTAFVVLEFDSSVSLERAARDVQPIVEAASPRFSARLHITPSTRFRVDASRGSLIEYVRATR